MNLSILIFHYGTFLEDRLYWCDTLRETINSINVDGSERREEGSRPGIILTDIIAHDDSIYVTEYSLLGG